MDNVSRAPEGWEGDWPPPSANPTRPKQFPPTIRHLVNSNEYLKLSPKEREALARDFMQANEEQQNDFLRSLTYKNPVDKPRPASRPVKELAKDAVANTVDMVGSIGGAAAGSILGPAGSVAGDVIGSVGADRFNRAIGLRDPKKVDTILGQYENNTFAPHVPFVGNVDLGPVTTGDVASAAGPLLGGVVRGATRGLTKPAQRAVTNADAENAANQADYQTGKNEALLATQRQVAEADATAKAKVEAWQAKRTDLDRRFQEDMAKIQNEAALTDQQKQQAYQQRVQEYNYAVKEHTNAYHDLPATGLMGMDEVGGHQQAYAARDAAALKSSLVDLTGFNQSAKDLGVQFGLPADQLQNSRFRNLSESLSEFGAATPATTTQGALINPVTNQPFKASTPGTPGGMSLDRVFATQKQLGRLIGKLSKTGGEEFGAAKQLFSELDDALRAHAAKDPAAAEAVAAHLEGNHRFMREKNAERWYKLWRDSKNQLDQDHVELDKGKLLNGLADLEENDRFWSRGWTPEERDQFWRMVEAAPGEGVPKVGSPPEPVDPGKQLRSRQHRYDQQSRSLDETKPSGEPDYSHINYPSFPEPPEHVNPEMSNFPYGPAITTKIATAEIGGRLTGQGGPSTFLGTMAALAVHGIPYGVSKALLSFKGGEGIARAIASGQQKVTPAFLQGLTTYLKSQGVFENEE